MVSFGFEDSVNQLIAAMIRSKRYRAIIWAGGFPGHAPHSRSDVDLYTISTESFPHHWMGERVGERRVEVTAYTLEQWQEILGKCYRHPKHHFTFANGRVLYDPENLCPPLSQMASAILSNWQANPEHIEWLRIAISVQHDKTMGYAEKKQLLHLRYHAIGCVHLSCELLVNIWDGYAVDGGKNLTRVLEHPHCPEEIKNSLRTLLSTPDTHKMAEAATALCRQCLEFTGGPVNSFHGGIRR